jgi:WD40 repeat protein
LINSSAIELLHCVTADGSLYFSRDPFTRNEEIFVSRYRSGKFTEPEKLGKSFNSEDYEAALLIAPDEEFMLISHTGLQHQGVKFSICYKKADGSWSRRIEAPFYCGGFFALSPDGKYLFFMNEGIWWVRTSFIDELKLKVMPPTDPGDGFH